MTVQIQAITETGIYVDDLDATERFYRDVLGLADPAGNSMELVTPGVWGLPSGW